MWVEAGVPTYNIDAICRGAASIAHVLETTAPVNAQNCREDERSAHQQLLQQWTQFDAADRVMCDGAAQSGTVEPTYTELMTCLEVARDNRDKATHVAQRPDQSHQPTAVGASPAQGAAPIRNALAGHEAPFQACLFAVAVARLGMDGHRGARKLLFDLFFEFIGDAMGVFNGHFWINLHVEFHKPKRTRLAGTELVKSVDQ